MQKTHIREIFTSIQGEGPYLGYKQIFVRFCGCNLNCKYCDTETAIANSKEYDTKTLANIINASHNIHSVALTGGEPLLHTDFLSELLPVIKFPVYLETNATLAGNLEKIINGVTFISADIKLKSSSGMDTFDLHEKFFEVCNNYKKETFAKAVFNSEITDLEIENLTNLVKKFKLPLILQPEMNGNDLFKNFEKTEDIFDKISDSYQNTRLIPQTHKFLNLK